MTAARRTLEEIEALAAEATPGPWGFFKHDCKELPGIDSFEVTFRDKYATAWIQSSNTHGVEMDRDMSRGEAAANAALIASLPSLLAIAQGQREELERLRANASTAAFDKINDQLREANRENEELRGLLGNAGQADIERQYCNCNP